MEIKDRIYKTEKVEWEKLKELQPSNLKLPYHNDKIKQNLIEHNFSSPFEVCELDGEIYIIDGHLRKELLYELINDGYSIPSKLTCNFIEVKDKADAVKTLVQVFNSKKNPMDQPVTIQMLEEAGVEIEEISLSSLNIISIPTDNDYSILDEEDEEINNKIKQMEEGVKKAIQIEFEPEDYDRATELVKYARNKQIYIGEYLINMLQDIKDGYEE